MLGDGLRSWHEFFSGIVVYRVTEHGPNSDGGWVKVTEYERRFERDNLLFNGHRYDPSDIKQRNALQTAIINWASALCVLRLLERRRTMVPPSLAYRVTPLGRRLDRLGYGDSASWLKKLIFAVLELIVRASKHKWIVAAGATGWAILNALKFYLAVAAWISNEIFALVSGLIIAFLIMLGLILRSGSHAAEGP